jgi:crotonobetainyl-CoA:carnitine CoA-transferase CaiB-like acyl-CoA transferase
MTGMYAVVGILAALQHRNSTGQGQHIDIALLDTQIAWLVNAGTNFLASHEAQRRLGNGHPNIVPYQVFDTHDAPMILAVGNDLQFARFCDVAELPHLATDVRFSTNPQRVAHRDELCVLIGERLRATGRSEWLERLEGVGVPCGPVNDLDAVFADPHVRARGAELHMSCDWAQGGTLKLLANPLKLSASPVSYRRVPPRLDEHHDQVLRDWLDRAQPSP